MSTHGEKPLGKQGLCPDRSIAGSATDLRVRMAVTSFWYGTVSLREIADHLENLFGKILMIIKLLLESELIYPLDNKRSN